MDLTAGIPLRPSTPLPGHWLLKAPSTVHISIFAAKPSDAIVTEDLVVRLRDDPIETAWRDINSSGDTRVLGRCAVVVPGKRAEAKDTPTEDGAAGKEGTENKDPNGCDTQAKPDGADGKANANDSAATDNKDTTDNKDVPGGDAADSKSVPADDKANGTNQGTDGDRLAEIDLTKESKPEESTGKRLWVFSTDEIDAPEGLVLVERPLSIDISATLSCDVHGQTLTCLAPGSECSPVFTPTPAWKYFESAAGEKLAWKLGQRLSLLPSPLRIDRSPPVSVKLRPTSHEQLLLTARPRSIAHCAPRVGPPISAAGRSPLVLRPLALPALLVGPFAATSAQDARLASAFDAMGAEWKNGRTESRIATQALGARPSDWSIYFVPLRTNRVAKMLPTTVAAQWRGTPGVLTVWPTHLARPLAPSPLTPEPKPPAPVSSLGDAPELLSESAGLWDFFSAYTEPASDGDEEDGDETMEEVPLAPEIDDAPDDESRRETASDVDDLFSASPSPEPEPVEVEEEPFIASAFTSPRVPAPALELELDMDDLFGAETQEEQAEEKEEVVQEVVEEVAVLEDAPSRPDTDMGDRNDVTEDDFNFFDSPAKQTEPTPQAHVEATPAAAAETPVPVPEPPAAVEPTPEIVSLITGPTEVIEPEPEPSTVAVVEDKPTPPSPEPEVAVVKMSRKRSIDIVPPAFAPLQLPKRPRMRFAYGLPSPLSPATTLRYELVERLRENSGKGKSYDYAEAWELSSESSDSEAESAFTTGAPPTPSSSDDEGTPAPSGLRAASVASPPANDDVLFDGSLCVGSEWVSLKDDFDACTTLARAWGNAWVELPPEPPEYVPLSPEAEADGTAPVVDLDAVVNAAVRQRFLRALLSKEDSEETTTPAPLACLGVPLAELTQPAEADDPNASYALQAPNVHVGMGGAILRLSAAALKYWRELGLQPAGGKKDLQAYVVCEPGEGERIAKTFLHDMDDVYRSHQLGTHDPGEESAGIIAVPPSEASAAVARLSKTGVVVYVLTYSTSPRTLLPLLKDGVHVVPVASARIGNLAPLAFEVYEAQTRLVQRVQLRGRQLPPGGPMAFHAFTLALPPQRPRLTMSWPQESYDVLGRDRRWHAAYALIGSNAIVACVDEQGDAMDVRVVSTDIPSISSSISSTIQTLSAGECLDRLSITRVGVMPSSELAAWKAEIPKFSEAKVGVKGITLLSVDPPPARRLRPRSPVANIPPAVLADSSATIVDETLAGASAPLRARVPIESGSEVTYPQSAFVLSVADRNGTGAVTSTFQVLSVTEPEVVANGGAGGKGGKEGGGGKEMEELAARFYELTCLGRTRYDLDGMPIHVEAVVKGAEAVGVVQE